MLKKATHKNTNNFIYIVDINVKNGQFPSKHKDKNTLVD